MPGVKVADGAIIGTNSLVTKNIGPYEVWGGNPARLIRKRFSDEIIEYLEKIQWWNWDIKKIAENVDVLIGKDLEKLKKIATTL